MKTQNYPTGEMIRDIWAFISPSKTKFFLGSFARITSDIVWLFPIWALSEIITFASEYQAGESQEFAWILLIAIILSSIYHFIFHDVAKYLLYQVAENANINAQKKAIHHLYDIDLHWHEKENSGNKMQRIVKGGGSLDAIIRIYVDLFIESTINVIAILIILFALDWRLSAILLFFFFSYYFLSYFLTKKAVRQSHVVNLEWENFNGIAFESINNISLVKSLRIGDKIFPFLTTIGDRLTSKIKKRIYYYRIRAGALNIYQEFFRIMMIAFTLWQIFQGHFAIGTITMVLLYFGKIEAAAYEFSETYSEFITAKIAMLRMKEIFREIPHVENSGTQAFSPDWKTLEFKNIFFSYHGQEVLKNFSLVITRGEKIGIVGISGTGKSTLFKLILKLTNEYRGDISFDGISLKDIRRASYMKSVAIVPQETELFHLSLEQNVTLSQEEKDEEHLGKALHISHVQDFAHKLLQGIQSLVGEKGIRLSGGERQRVGIARAIYQKPEILLLDEATSHLDIASEQKIQEALHAFFQDITAIVIAHRLSTLREMDRIVVMDQGSVLELGTFDELMEKKGAFFQLWKQQQL